MILLFIIKTILSIVLLNLTADNIILVLKLPGVIVII
nr:MAG TPA: hypothetical protein [Caudoviricetes sp.]